MSPALSRGTLPPSFPEIPAGSNLPFTRHLHSVALRLTFRAAAHA